jgi:SlyX protein
MSDSLEDQIIELQTKLQFQEETLQKLDEVVVQQSDLIDRLHRRLKELEDRLEQMRYERGEPESLKDEKPPHY